MWLLRKKNLCLAVTNLLLCCLLFMLLVFVRRNLLELYGIKALKNGQRSVFLLSQNVYAGPIKSNPVAQVVDDQAMHSQYQQMVDSIPSGNKRSIQPGAPLPVDNRTAVQNKQKFFIITGLGFNVSITKKILENLPSDVALGMANMNQRHEAMLASVPNKIFIHVPVSRGENFNAAGLSESFSLSENMQRMSENIASFQKVSGIYLDINELIAGGSNVASIVFRMAKEKNLPILNINAATSPGITEKLQRSPVKFATCDCFIGYAEQDTTTLHECLNSHVDENKGKVIAIAATEANIDRLIAWFNQASAQNTIAAN